MPLKLTRNQIIIICSAGAIILFFVLIFTGVIPGMKPPTAGDILGGGENVKISFWGVANDETLQPIFGEYQKIYKGVEINYTQFETDNYEKELVNALAAGRGPDIFMLHNTWLPKHYDKILPLTEAQLPLTQFQQMYPTVAEQDFVRNAEIFALPLYLDTLALLYNKDIFDAKGVALAPTTWQEFQEMIPQLREINPLTNKISQAAAAIGGSEQSVSGAADLLSLFMLQANSPMSDSQSGRANFGKQGLNALNFYVQFANPLSDSYTWSDDLRYSLDSFAEGKTAIIFNYASQISFIKSKNPFINIGISPMPQLNPRQPINYASYWGLTVSNQSRLSAQAWNFVLYLTANPQTSEQYLKSVGLPPALRALIQKYLNDPSWRVFSHQALTARSWRQTDSSAIKKIFSNMIELILSGRVDSDNALKQAENEINNL